MKLKIIRLPENRIWFKELKRTPTNTRFLPEDEADDLDLRDYYSVRPILRYGVEITEDQPENAEWVVFTTLRERDKFISESTDGKV